MAHDDVDPNDDSVVVPRGEPEPEPEQKPRFRDQSAQDMRVKLAGWKQRAEARDAAQPKLTREQLGQQVTQRQQRRAEAKAKRLAEHEANPQRRTSRVSMAIGAAGVVGAVLVAGVIAMSQPQHDAQLAQQHQDMAELRHQIAQLTPDAVVDDGDVEDTAEIADAVYADTQAARSAAEAVAEDQQRFAALYYDSNDEVVTEDSAKPSAVAAAEHRSQMAQHFSPSANVAAVDDLDDPSTTVPFAQDQMDARYPWYLQRDSDGFVDPDDYQWEVGGVTPVQGNTDVVWVTWLNHDTDTGELLAWAQSHYDVESALFTMIEVGYSATGSTRGGVSGATVDDEPGTLFDEQGA